MELAGGQAPQTPWVPEGPETWEGPKKVFLKKKLKHGKD